MANDKSLSLSLSLFSDTSPVYVSGSTRRYSFRFQYAESLRGLAERRTENKHVSYVTQTRVACKTWQNFEIGLQ